MQKRFCNFKNSDDEVLTTCTTFVKHLRRRQGSLQYTLFFIRTSNFGAEAERSYIFLRFEAENVLKMFLNYMVYTTCISVNQCGREQKTYQSALPAEIWYQELLIMTNRDVCHYCTKHALKYGG